MVIREDCEERRSLKLEAEKRERFDFERQRQAGPDKFFCLQAQFQSRLPTKFKTLLMFSLFNMLSRLSFIIHIWFLQASSSSFASFFLFFFFLLLVFLLFLPTKVPTYKRRLRACKHCRVLATGEEEAAEQGSTCDPHRKTMNRSAVMKT